MPETRLADLSDPARLVLTRGGVIGLRMTCVSAIGRTIP